MLVYTVVEKYSQCNLSPTPVQENKDDITNDVTETTGILTTEQTC